MIRRRDVVKGAAASALSLAAPRILRAQAANWPRRNIRLICPFAAGGATDVIARTIGSRLSETWGQQVVVENRGGGGTNIGAQAAASAAPDGYTFFITSFNHAVNRFMYKTLSYDPVADFAPVSLICMQPNIMVVPNSSPAKTVKEFIAYAKSHPGKISYGSGGVGTSVHLCGELFKRMTGIEMTHVAYRGSALAMNDIIPGRLDVMFDNITASMPQVKGGNVRALAVTTKERVKEVPDLPTIAEAGVPGFEVSSWFAFLVPAKTPPEIAAKMQADTAEALKYPPVKQLLEQLGAILVGSTQAELATFLQAEMDKWGPVVRDAHIQISE